MNCLTLLTMKHLASSQKGLKEFPTNLSWRLMEAKERKLLVLFTSLIWNLISNHLLGLRFDEYLQSLAPSFKSVLHQAGFLNLGFPSAWSHLSVSSGRILAKLWPSLLVYSLPDDSFIFQSFQIQTGSWQDSLASCSVEGSLCARWFLSSMSHRSVLQQAAYHSEASLSSCSVPANSQN